jgi:hypothetical protein
VSSVVVIWTIHCPRMCGGSVTEPLSNDSSKLSKESNLSSKDKTKGLGYTDLPNIEKIQNMEFEKGVHKTSTSHKRSIIESERLTDSDLTVSQRFKLRLFGYVYIGHRTQTGWNGPLPFFAIRCPVHGLVEDYPHGNSDRLDCPRCQREEKLLRELIG